MISNKNTIIYLLSFLYLFSSEELKADHLKEFSALLKESNLDFSTYLYTRSYTSNKSEAQNLANEIKQLGLQKIYLYVNAKHINSKKNNAVSIMLKAFKEQELEVYAILYDHTTAKEYGIAKTSQTFQKFQTEHSPYKFDGILCDIEPHILKASYKNILDLGLYWNSKRGYGVNNSNDMLMAWCLTQLAKIRQCHPKTPIIQANPHFFEDKYLNNDLSIGSMNDFYTFVDQIQIMAYATNSEKIKKIVSKETESSSKQKFELAIKVTHNQYNSDVTSFSKHSCEYFLNSLKEIIHSDKLKSKLSGICFFEYHGLIKLLTKP